MWWGISTVLAFTLAVTISFIREGSVRAENPQIAMDQK
jgi:hypothetical protein